MSLLGNAQDALSASPRCRAFIGMGGNLGDVPARLLSALDGLSKLPGTCVEAVSSRYQSKPVDAGGPDYINAVAVIQSALGPHELLNALLALESAHDRERSYRNAPRTLDLDLLWYEGAVVDTESLTLPHPRMMQRAFVLEPLAEVMVFLLAQQEAPRKKHPDSAVWPTLPDEMSRQALAQQQGISCQGPLVWVAS
ncbi:MAG: 2-amino-4-hydroxy-6-hydroxymethyldihydropteridine diphosphokinase [Aquabacterium sp.]|nr:2-amino-4-hydroxy-6-hydroxymethyldihydropteridine diphosphokinase [Aquabacterium sp.]